jgi:Protein of unknown function (DUF3313)
MYANPNVQRNHYDKIMLETVEFWDSSNSTVSQIDQHMLTAYFLSSPRRTARRVSPWIDQGGPEVIVSQVAMVNASGATVGLPSVSVVIRQLRMINAAQWLATGSCAFGGSAKAEMKATDAMT